ncbi:patatin-like phospholipase family protein [Hydrogenoanaerobacterium sp.]|uniref:patatin-like phospholipase family protein n=1 Tax=Hydrogenoanaerobacterium sp. TaxID=2953763 RepID=UPI00289D3724|nr:patatin-like phospholipase family protein [Hydrogenoanaerobacterium sp.]
MGKTALVLAGGGSRGSYELGVWQALREMDITIDIVTGTSIGAINGSLIAQGDYETAVALWDKIETSHVFDVQVDEQQSVRQKVVQTYRAFVRNFIKSGGTDSNPLKETLSAYFDEDRIRSSPIDFGVVTMEMDSRKSHELFKNEMPKGKMIDYILASASIYPAIKPYVIDGVRYVDGAYYDNLPVKMALARGATSIIAVDLEAFGVVKKEELRLARQVKYIRSYWDLGPTLVFDRTTMRRNIRLGYLDALKAYGAYDGHAFTFITGFADELATLFTEQLYLDGLFRGDVADKSSMLDKLFWGRISKFLEERGITEPAPRDIALVCAEVAGETFGLSNEKIYSKEVWLRRLKAEVDSVEVPEALTGSSTEGKRRILETLRETTTLLNKRVRTKYAALAIKEILELQDIQKLLTNVTIMPDAFLGGAYLALNHLV